MPKIKKRNNSAKNVRGVTSFNLCKITRRNNSAKNVGGATIGNLCKMSGHALYLCQVS